MPFVDTRKLEAFQKGIGWRGRLFHSPSMTFGHWEFDQGASVHEHWHAQEEVWEVLEGELKVTIDGVTQIAVPGVVAIVPPNVVHSVKALRAGKAIVVDYPLRPDLSSLAKPTQQLASSPPCCC
jgi:quercetin dioxygenase-like cupin family protein